MNNPLDRLEGVLKIMAASGIYGRAMAEREQLLMEARESNRNMTKCDTFRKYKKIVMEFPR